MEIFRDAHGAALRPDKLKKVNLFDSPRMFCDVYGLNPGRSRAPTRTPAPTRSTSFSTALGRSHRR